MTDVPAITLWLPRDDEHALAASLGMCESDQQLLRDLIGAAEKQILADTGVAPMVKRWHVWRVVRAMARAGVNNTPDGRAAAFALLASTRREDSR